MFKIGKIIITAIILLFLSFPIILYFFNIKNNDFIYLKILNSEDYIYLQENKNDPKDLILQFEDYYNNKILGTNKKKIRVIYDTFDTPENAFGIIKKDVKYDLICVSEYIIQKMANLNLINLIEKEKIPNYFNKNNKNHCSPFIHEQLKKISTNDKKTLDDYSLCYMWGTLGIGYNPEHNFFKKNNISIDEIEKDLQDLNNIWENDKYKNAITVKNSVRDLYSFGSIKTFEKEIKKEKDNFKKNKIFNYGCQEDLEAEKHINQVYDNLSKFKKNIHGFEIDNGKEDIVKGKNAIDLFWSGDAIYAIQKAKKEKNLDLYYSIPSQGTNMWFDNWVIPKNSENKEISYEFLNFIFDYNHAIENMKYTGFTSSIIGDDIFNFFKKKYDKKNGNYLYNVNYFFKTNEKDQNEYFLNILEKEKNNLISAQFVEEKNISYLMVMQDFGKNNEILIKKFNDFKNDSLPIYNIILLVFEFLIFLFFIIKRFKFFNLFL